MAKSTYNKTQLNPEITLEKHVFHRDQFAHVFRWSHVLKRADLGMNILDFGCGSGNLCELLYRNRYKANLYLGLDIRKKTIEGARERFHDVQWAQFQECDLVTQDMKTIIPDGVQWDLICSFEVLEHIGKSNATRFINNLKYLMTEKTVLLLSTPCFDANVGAADNHTFDCGDGKGSIPQELTYDEVEDLFKQAGLKIQNHWGTFASVKDYKPHLAKYPGLKEIYERLHEYYDSNVLSNLMAPLFPEHSRNVLWEVTLCTS